MPFLPIEGYFAIPKTYIFSFFITVICKTVRFPDFVLDNF
jgi:hypothetical protein